MGRDPFASRMEVSMVTSSDSQPNTDQKAAQDDPSALFWKAISSENAPYQASANIKVNRRPSLSASGASRTGADANNPEEGGRGK